MQFREKTGQSLTEPVTITELKIYLGYTATDQDNYFTDLIKSVRRWAERYTSLSAISKIYQVNFSEYDYEMGRGWLTLPISPVKTIDSVKYNGTAIDYDSKGLLEQSIYVAGIDYLGIDVEYTSDVTDHLSILKDAIYEICAETFLNKSGSVKIPASIITKLSSVKIPAI